MMVFEAEKRDVMSYAFFDDKKHPVELDWAVDPKETKLLSHMNSELLRKLDTEKLSYENHGDGVTLESFEKDPKLNESVRVLATNLDRNGNTVVSLIEHKTLPFYGLQFHPEKNSFLWYPGMDIHYSVT